VVFCRSSVRKFRIHRMSSLVCYVRVYIEDILDLYFEMVLFGLNV